MNPTSLKALTWGTVITALVSALLLAAAGAMLPEREEARPSPSGGAPVGMQRQSKAGSRQQTPTATSAPDPH